jgi:hypothetical protein
VQKAFWIAGFSSLSAFKGIENDEDFKFMVEAVEERLNSLSAEDKDKIFIQREMNCDNRIPFRFRATMKAVWKKLREIPLNDFDEISSPESASISPSPQLRKRRQYQKLPTVMTEIEGFAFEDSVRTRVVGSVEGICGNKFDESELLVEETCAEFPKTWNVTCPIADCGIVRTVSCRLEATKSKNKFSLNFCLYSLNKHLKRDHGNVQDTAMEVEGEESAGEEQIVVEEGHLEAEEEVNN